MCRQVGGNRLKKSNVREAAKKLMKTAYYFAMAYRSGSKEVGAAIIFFRRKLVITEGSQNLRVFAAADVPAQEIPNAVLLRKLKSREPSVMISVRISATGEGVATMPHFAPFPPASTWTHYAKRTL